MKANNKVEAVLFDLDGVIVFTDRYHYLGWKRLADEQGWAFDEAVNDGCRGVPRLASLEVILKHNGVELGEAEKEALAARKNGYYVELLGAMSAEDIYPGAVELLERLRTAGALIGLCSSSRNAVTVVRGLGLEQYFDVVVTGADIERAKPDPEIFLKGAALLGVEPGSCVVFEDAPSGVAAALAAGMSCVGVGTPDLLAEAPVTLTDYAQVDVASLLSTGHPFACEEAPSL
jgi:beta-phosphoglucomutase